MKKVPSIWEISKALLREAFQRAAESARVRELKDELAAKQAEIETLKVELARAKEQATTDELTGIANRNGFNRAISGEINRLWRQRNGKFALLFLDLDGFKPINDTFGHNSGNECLIELAKRLTENTRGNDTVGRLGGDEFVILASGATKENFERHFLEIYSKIFAPITLSNGKTIQVDCSFGVVEYDRSQQPQRPTQEDIAQITKDLLETADQKMYKMKKEAARKEAERGETNGANQQGSSNPSATHSPELKRA